MNKVTVVMPVYNAAKWLCGAIDAVLAQTYADFELVIYDDGSSDESAAIAQRYEDSRIKVYCSGENLGLKKVGNEILRVVKDKHPCEYLVVALHDDRYEPEFIERALKEAAEYPGCGMVCAHPLFIGENEQPIDISTSEDVRTKIPKIRNMTKETMVEQFKSGPVFVGGWMYRFAWLEKIGYCDEKLEQLADLDLYIRIAKHSSIQVIEEPLYRFMLRENNSTAPTEKNLQTFAAEFEYLKKKHFQPKMKVMIATPFYEMKGWSNYILSLVSTLTAVYKYTKLEIVFSALSGDSYVDRARNAMAMNFLNSDCTDLVFIDSDMGWDIEAFMKMIIADEDFIGAGYPCKNNWDFYGVKLIADKDGRPMISEKGYLDSWIVPAGFCKIRKPVFNAIQVKYPEDYYYGSLLNGKEGKIQNFFGKLSPNEMLDLPHQHWGEDSSFCMRWKACGGKIWTIPDCTISHVGVMEKTGNLQKHLAEDEIKKELKPLFG